MAEEEREPDFKDLLAAFDIPDVSSSSAAAAKMQRPNAERNKINNIETDKKKHEESDTNHKSHSPPVSSSSSSSGNNSEESPVIQENNCDNQTQEKGMNGSAPPEATSSKHGYKNIKDEMDMYQLSTNAMPSYMPAIPPQARFNMNVPTDGFKCLDCNDTFLFEASLIQHLQRRSVYITFDCDTCHKLLIYYNRCSLLSHIRSHLEKNETADIKKASVNPLPPELMNGFHGFVPPFPMLPAALMQHLQMQQSMPLVVNSPQSMQSHLSSLQNHMSAKSPTISRSTIHHKNNMPSIHNKEKFSCSECCQNYDSATALEDHFVSSQNLPLDSSKCSKCNMTCVSKCSLSAHERIHVDAKPYVCPECGKLLGNRETFLYHVNFKCLHYARVIGYKCSICLTFNSDPIMMRNHIISEHTEAYFKCQACPMAFKASHSFESHKKTAHLTMDVDCKTIYKCPLCDIVFQGDAKLNEHLDMHIKEQIQNIKFVFKCMTCSELFNSKPDLESHIAQNHPDALKKKACPECELVFETADELERHQSENHSESDADGDNQNKNNEEDIHHAAESTWSNGTKPSSPCVCSNCGDVFHDKNRYLAHKQTCGSKVLQCSVCQLVAKDEEELVADGRRHLDSGIMVCLLCSNNQRFENKKSLFKHIEVHVTDDSQLDCVLCHETFNDSKDLLKHLRSEHGFNPVKCDMCDAEFYGSARMQRHKASMHTESSANLKCPLCTSNQDTFATQGFLDKHLIISHNLSLEEIGDLRDRLPNKSQPIKSAESPKIKLEPVFNEATSSTSPPSTEIDDLEPPPNKKINLESPSNGNDELASDRLLICSKCQFSSTDRSVFWKHIATHKTDESAYQCLECGSCFVVIPSLRKHMFLVHKIRDFDAYVAEAGQHLIADPQDLHSENGTSLYCDVCCQSFGSESALKNHMRNHGMAFVRSHSTSLVDENERSN